MSQPMFPQKCACAVSLNHFRSEISFCALATFEI